MKTGFTKYFLILFLALMGSSCQIGYLFKSGYHQMRLLSKRVPVEKVLEDPSVDESVKKQLRVAQETRKFSENVLKLSSSKNYTSYVQLDQPYVSYVVSASPKWKLEHHLWSFPMVGEVPYKGFANEADAKEEEKDLQKKNLDTYLRGVSAYSTLGWFNDPILSSMIRYKDYQLVNTIIHETVHATLYIKNSADFNERMAVFLGNKGTELFYQQKEGLDSPTLKQIQAENEDDKIFSKFISGEMENLKNWYQQINEEKTAGAVPKTEEARSQRILQIQNDFTKTLLPKLKTDNYKSFAKMELNNARLMIFKTYMQDLSDFQKLFDQTEGNFTEFLKCCEKLKKEDQPEIGLKKLIESLSTAHAKTCT